MIEFVLGVKIIIVVLLHPHTKHSIMSA